MPDIEAKANPRVTWTECVLVGVLLFGLVGTCGVLLILHGLIHLIRPGEPWGGEFDLTLVPFAAMAAAITGVAAWRRIVATVDSPPRRGAWAGLVVGILAHPLCWFLVIAFQVCRDPVLRGQSLHDTAFSLVFMTVLATIPSLGLVGWFSAPFGAALGYLAKRIPGRHAVGGSRPRRGILEDVVHDRGGASSRM